MFAHPMSKLIKEPDFIQFGNLKAYPQLQSQFTLPNMTNQCNRNSNLIGQKDRNSGIHNVLIQISRNISFNTNARISSLSQNDYAKIYENIDQDPKLQKARAWIQRKKYKKLLHKARYRLKIISELIVTEENYVSKLQKLMELVYKPLLWQSKPLEQRNKIAEYQALPPQLLQQLQDTKIQEIDVQNIFSNLEKIIELNSKFANSMRSRKQELTNSDNKCEEICGEFTDVCVQYAPQLKIYVTYLNNYENATNTLDNLKATNSRFQNYRLYTENYELNGQDFQDFLIKPVQRLPKYILLLKDLLKNTDPNHRDYINVQTALKEFNQVCSHNNEQMDKFIRKNKLIELHRKFCKPKLQIVQQQDNQKIKNLVEQNQSSEHSSQICTPQNNQQVQNRFSLNPFQAGSIFGIKEAKSKPNLSGKNQSSNSSSFNNNLNHPDTNIIGDFQIYSKELNREFLWEEILSLFQNDTQRIVTVYFLTDLILVSAKESQEKGEYLLKYLQLNEASFYKNMSDLKYFSNLFRISGKNESLTFICESDESKSVLISRINKQILVPLKLKRQQRVVKKQEKLELQNKFSSSSDNTNAILNNEKSNKSEQINVENRSISQIEGKDDHNQETAQDDIQFPIQVTILGTEERTSSNKLKELFTVYIAEIQIGEHIKQKVFVRYSEMISLKEFIQKNIKQITGFEDLPRNFFFHHKTKVIEKRKILIENFLQKVLSHQGLQHHPQCSYILSFLNLPENFYSLPQNIGESNFDFLNNLNQEITNNEDNQIKYPSTIVPPCQNELTDDSEEDEEQLQYENGIDCDTYNEDGVSLNQKGNGYQKKRHISVGASKFLNKQKLNMKMQIQNGCDMSITSQNQNQNQENNISSNQINFKMSDSIDSSSISNQSSVTQNTTGSGIKSTNQNLSSSQILNFSNTSVRQSQQSLYTFIGDEKEIEIFTLDDKCYKININKYTKALDVCDIISRKIGLVNFLDFRLYIEDEKKNIRFLDDDEPIFKLIFKKEFMDKNLEMKDKEKESSLMKIKNLKNSFLNKLGLKHTSKYKLKFCKYLWLEQDLEEFDYKSDPVRLQLMASQILNDISKMKFILENKDYYLYSSLYFFIYHPEIINAIFKDNSSKTAKNNIYSKIKEFLPPAILKQRKENVWIENLIVYIETISEELSHTIRTSKQIIRNSFNASSPASNKSNKSGNYDFLRSHSSGTTQNTEQSNIDRLKHYAQNQSDPILDTKQIQNQNQSSEQGGQNLQNILNSVNNPPQSFLQQINTTILTDRKKIACMILLDTFKKNPLYGATMFYCETYKKTIKDAKEHGVIIPQNVYCCIKCDSIQIMDSSKQKKIKSFVFSDIQETKVFPSSITFILKNEPNAYRFDTTQSFEISQLLSAYNHIMIDIQKNALTLDEESAKLRLQNEHLKIQLILEKSLSGQDQHNRSYRSSINK